ncbi:MAG TPA: heavy metal-associated domain-containing protein [Nitrospiria bacterium]|nr:heavy metal-associated domain-containing protein [Nitrospiria bacterium]
MRRMWVNAVMAVVLVMGILAIQTQAADQQVTLMLGGQYCEFYPKEITDALMAVKGVKSVDLQSMKGHAIVEHDGSVKEEQLLDAIKTVKGTKGGVDWYCDAEVMK